MKSLNNSSTFATLLTRTYLEVPCFGNSDITLGQAVEGEGYGAGTTLNYFFLSIHQFNRKIVYYTTEKA